MCGTIYLLCYMYTQTNHWCVLYVYRYMCMCVKERCAWVYMCVCKRNAKVWVNAVRRFTLRHHGYMEVGYRVLIITVHRRHAEVSPWEYACLYLCDSFVCLCSSVVGRAQRQPKRSMINVYTQVSLLACALLCSYICCSLAHFFVIIARTLAMMMMMIMMVMLMMMVRFLTHIQVTLDRHTFRCIHSTDRAYSDTTELAHNFRPSSCVQLIVCHRRKEERENICVHGFFAFYSERDFGERCRFSSL